MSLSVIVLVTTTYNMFDWIWVFVHWKIHPGNNKTTPLRNLIVERTTDPTPENS